MGLFSRFGTESNSSSSDSSSSDISSSDISSGSARAGIGLDNESRLNLDSSGLESKAAGDRQQAQQLVRLMVLQTLNQQVQKTCFSKCFSTNKFYAQLSKSDHVCLAKCMDRM